MSFSYVADERWVPIPGVEGYEVSSLGRFRSVDRWVRQGDHLAHYRGRPCKAFRASAGGYLQIRLLGTSRYAHRLVLEAFVGPAPEGMECRHLNGDPADNRLVNLQWGTKKENSQDSLRHGTHPSAARTHCPRNHPLTEPNLVPSQLRKGYRTCLACSRAQSHAHNTKKRKGVVLDLASTADAYFAEITKGI